MKRLLIIPLLAATACTADAKKDLPQDNQDVVAVDVTVFRMPDDFPNVVFFCNNLTGVYLTTREHTAALPPVPNDPACFAPEGG